MEPAGSTFFWSFAFFVLAAPLYRGGNRALPLLALELAAIGFLLALALRRYGGAALPPLPRLVVAALAVFLAYPLLQLVPLPESLWRALPGHAGYAAVVEGFGAPGAEGARRAISLVPAATEYGWLAMLPPLAALLAVRAFAPAQVVALLAAMTILAGLQGLVGLLQVAGGEDSFLHLGDARTYGTATGTFVNRNHLAAMLAMMLPVVVGLLLYRARHGRHGGLRLDASASNVLSQRALVFASAALILLCLLFTRSRAGIATALMGLVFSSILFVRARSGSRHAKPIVVALAVTGIALAALIGLTPLLERLEPGQLRLSGEGRLALYAATLRGAIEFLPFGSGLSTYASVFPRFQEGVGGAYYDFAHNDYLQLVMETGIAGAVAVALLLVAYVMRMADLVIRGSERSFTLLQVAAGVGLAPLILHSAFDFPLHMPGIAVWFATLAGAMLHPGVRDAARDSAGGRRRGPGASRREDTGADEAAR